ncbi:MAG: ATP synthase F1 subunit delta [Blastocatellia bacterium]|nr:MAG: ATP synthase F1 subunit delta [Blastocatellia bacterium]
MEEGPKLSLQTVARRYASALADVVTERREQQEVRAEIEYWANMLDSSPKLQEVFSNPTVPFDQKRRLLEELISRTRIKETTASFLRVLLHNQRLTHLKEISERFALVLDDRAGVVAAEVTTARPISEHLRSDLQEALTAVIGRRVRVTFNTDEAIVGGMVAKIGSTVFDGSVRNQFERLAVGLAGTIQ